MAKIDPNNLPASLDAPETDHAARRPEDLTTVEQFVAKIKGMLVGDEYDYADATLRGILGTVERRQLVTEAQRQAVENISARPYSGTRRSASRGGW